MSGCTRLSTSASSQPLIRGSVVGSFTRDTTCGQACVHADAPGQHGQVALGMWVARWKARSPGQLVAMSTAELTKQTSQMDPSPAHLLRAVGVGERVDHCAAVQRRLHAALWVQPRSRHQRAQRLQQGGSSGQDAC